MSWAEEEGSWHKMRHCPDNNFVAVVVWYLGMSNFSSRTTTAIVRESGTGPLRKSLGSKDIIVGKFGQKTSYGEGVGTDRAMRNTIGKDMEQESLESADEKEAELEATQSNVKESMFLTLTKRLLTKT